MCDSNENMSLFNQCEYLSEQEITISYEKLIKGNLFEQISVFRRFEKNIFKRKLMSLLQMKSRTHAYTYIWQWYKYSYFI